MQHNGGTGSNQAGPTTNGVACVDKWVGSELWDVITMNFGIHDCCPGGDGRQAGQTVSKADYVKNLESIYSVLHRSLAKDGKILWITTTPIGAGAAGVCCGNGTSYDFPGCIDIYNQAAAAVFADKPDVEIVDLNAAVHGVCGHKYDQCNLQLHSMCTSQRLGRLSLQFKLQKASLPSWDPNGLRCCQIPSLQANPLLSDAALT